MEFKPLSPEAGPPMMPPVGLLIPFCAPAFIPMCAAAFVFSPVLVLLRVFIPICGALVELPIKPLCPTVTPVVAPLVGVRGVCARLNGTVAMQIAINPNLIDVI